MAPDSKTDARIDLPSEFADHLAAVGNLETAPETVGECWSKFADQLEASDQTIEPEGLYVEKPTRHEVRVDDRIKYSPCVLDALTAAVLEAQHPVTVRSVDPVTATPVTFTVRNETMSVAPEDAVVTFGIAPTIPELESSDESVFSWMLRAGTPNVSTAFCQYINAFESRETYDRWQAATDGKTVPMQPAAAEALIRQYVDPD